MKFSSICDEAGNALVEAVSFVTVAFGLVFSAGLGLFQLQASAIELQSVARNSLRSYLIGEEKSLTQLVRQNLDYNPIWREREVNVSVNCVPDCSAPEHRVILLLSAGAVQAKAFGVIK